MPSSIVKILAVAVLAFSSITSAAPVELSTRDLEKRDAWSSQSTCPSGDNEVYTGPKGGQWTVRCGMDTLDSTNIQVIQTDGFIGCIQACGNTSGCGRVVFTGNVNESGGCYLKSGSGGLTSSPTHKVATKLN